MTFQVRERVTVLPAVAGSQNGNGKAHTVRSVYDTRGRLVWAKSPRGYLTHFRHEDVTGAMIRRIDDVEVARAAGVPSGWKTPVGAEGI